MALFSSVLAAVLFLAALVGHEYAHAVTLHRLGIPISKAGLGLPLWPTWRKKARWRGRKLTLTLSPWLLGAYVSADPAYEDDVRDLPYRDAAWYLGAGVAFNIVFGLALGAASAALTGFWLWAAGMAAGAVLVGVFHRKFTTYVVPAIGPFCFVGLVGAFILANPEEPQGVVGIGRVIAAEPTSGPVLTLVAALAHAFELGAVINLALALLNMVPLYPLDGGQIFHRLVEPWLGSRVSSAFQIFGIAVVVGLFAYAILTDVLWLAA